MMTGRRSQASALVQLQLIVDHRKLITIAKDRTKNKSSRRTLPLVDAFYDLLMRLKQQQAENINSAGNRFHDLRHSCVTLLLSNGVSMKEIQEWLGHSDYSTTANIYSHLEYSSKVSSANKMSEVIKI